jgi:type IV pilus assembly protein PilB
MRIDLPAGGAARRRRGSGAEQVDGWPPLANVILAGKRVPKATLEAAVNQATQSGQPLQNVLLQLGVPEEEILKGIATLEGLKYVDLDRYSFNASASSLLPAKIARQYQALPIGWEYGTPVIAMADPKNPMARDEIRALIGKDYQIVLALPQKIAEYTSRLYGDAPPVQAQVNAPVADVGDSIFATMFAGNVPEGGQAVPVMPQIPEPPQAPVVPPPPVNVTANNSTVEPIMSNEVNAGMGTQGSQGINKEVLQDMAEESYSDEMDSDDSSVTSYDLSSFTGGSILFEDDYGDYEDEGDLNVSLDYLSDLGLGDEEEEDAIPPLANSLIAAGKVTPDQMESALAEHRATGKPLAQILTESGAVSEVDLIEAMAKEIGLGFVDLSDYPIDEEAAKRIPLAIARRHRVLLVGYDGDTALVAVANPSDMMAMDDLRSILGREFKPLVAAPSQIIEYIDKVYRADEEAEQAAEEAAKLASSESAGVEITNLETVVEDAPVIRFVNSIILQAINERASDIHVEPTDSDLRVRYRIDGVLHDFNRAPKNITAAVISRLKVMGELNIAEHRIPQDGRISLNAGNRKLDLRIASLPTVYGEKIVMRILDKSNALMSLEELGFYSDVLERYEQAYTKPYGIILITGPTGSGKSTTMYSTLNILNTPDKHVITVEDPVEYQIPGIIQMQVNHKAGLTFAKALKAILRGDPDIVMIGEIRDIETAQIAVEAALTGHLVLSSLHTNDAASTPMRLLEMGVEPFLVTSSMLCVVTQRLARKLCPKCKEPYEITDDELQIAGVEQYILQRAKEINVFRPKGCPACSKTGYRGRTSIAEVMLFTEQIERLVIDRASTEDIFHTAINEGMIPMKQDGFRKALDGITSIEEVLRVVA